MHFSIVCIGKLKEKYLRDGVEEFVKRMRVYGGITIVELNESKMGDKAGNTERQQAVIDEGKRLLKRIPSQAYIVLLDVYGKTMPSEMLATHISNLEVSGISEMVFVIGGPFGVSEELRKTANLKLSLSPMTFTHQMVRLLVVEQIYRTCKINRGEPYHW